MRGRVFKCALAVAGLGVVASAATALSTHAPTPYDQTLTLAGGANVVDPDAPIATARYGDAPRAPVSAVTVDLAGAASTTVLAGGPAPIAPRSVALAQASPQPAIQTLNPSAAPTPSRGDSTSSAQTPKTALALVRSSSSARRVRLVKIDDIQIRPFTPSDGRAAFTGVSVDASSLIGKMRPASQDARKGRWMLFAASSGKAVSLNVVRDSIVGWRGAGWAEERIARFGTHQLGIGWRKNGKQLSLSATRRSFRTQGYSDRDMVYGVNLSINGR